MTLPIYEIENGIIDALKQTNRLVLQAPTGSGKSTQVPQMLLNHGLLRNGQLVVLQPRRLATRLLASRVARELRVELGHEVGYQIRFENVTTPGTRIKFETEGILLRQMLESPELDGIQAIIFDEFHERHLYGDITLARALDIQEQRRPDLLIIVMSATLDAAILEKYLRQCVVLKSEGRTFPVDVDYLQRSPSAHSREVWDMAADAFAKHRPPEGDVLVFMPGGYEINRTIEAIKRRPESRGCLVLPLHGELPPREQDAAVAAYDQAKIVVATNVAETSITIEGVRLVIDSGLARVPRYDPNRGINTLLVERISQASADQRTGRAGRTAAGVCVRLWSKTEHEQRPKRDLPEIKRLDLAEVILTLKAAGVSDLGNFRWLDAPDPKALQHAETLLVDLGALQQDGDASVITNLGRRMLAFPLHPRYARMLLAAQEVGCVYEACLVAALTQGRDLLMRSAKRDVISAREDLFGSDNHTSDFSALIRAWEFGVENHFRIDVLNKVGIHAITARQVGPLLEQFLRIAKQEGLDIEHRNGSETALRKCILIGFSDRVARRLDDSTFRCELVHKRRGELARESVVRISPLFVAAEVREIGRHGGDVNTIVSLATAIERDWLTEMFPADIHSDRQATFNAVTRKVDAADVVRFRDLILSSAEVEPPADLAAGLLADEIVAGRLQVTSWDHAVEQWIRRLNLLARSCPDLQLPPLLDEDRRHILEQFCLGATSYKDIKARDVKPVVKSWLSPAARELVDKYAPERVTLSNGRTPKVIYEDETPPHISMRIQELFGVTQIPAIAMGRIQLNIHILAPSMRPVQVTRDLAGFWRDHYPRIKSELQRKYPKHEWR